MAHCRFYVADDDSHLAHVPEQSAHCDTCLSCSASFQSHFRHHFGGELLDKLKSALKILSITADHAMLQPTLLKVADIVNDRLDTSRERESPAFATLLLDSDTAVNGENCAHNLTRIATGPFRLGTHFRTRVAIKLRSIEGNARIGSDGVPAIAEATRAPTRTLDLSPKPNWRMR